MTAASKDSARSYQSGYITRRHFRSVFLQALFVVIVWSGLYPSKVLGLQSIRVTPSPGRRQLEPKPQQIRSIKPLEMTPNQIQDDATGSTKTKRTRRIHPTKYDQPAEQINKRSCHTEQSNNDEDEDDEEQPKVQRRIRRTHTARVPFGGPVVAQNGVLAVVVSPDPPKNQLQKIFRQTFFRLGKTFATYAVFALVCEDLKAFLRRDPVNLFLLMCIWSATSVGT